MISPFFRKLLLSRMVEIDDGEFRLFHTNFFLSSIKGQVLLREEMKKKKATEVLYSFGECITSDILDYFKSIGGRKEESMKFWLNMINLAGFGEIEITEINQKGYASVNCKNSPIAKEYLKYKKQDMVDEVLCGIIGGFFKEWFGSGVSCQEVSCIAKGSKQCQFTVRKSGTK
jgi:predicted hydrocarbon binding protein